MKTYLIFNVEDQKFAIDSTNILEILPKNMVSITKMPQMRNEIKGAFNFRGQSLLMLDLKYKMELKTTDYISVIVLQFGEQKLGITTDVVLEVRDIDDKDLLENNTKNPYIEKLLTNGDEIIQFLNIEKLLV